MGAFVGQWVDYMGEVYPKTRRQEAIIFIVVLWLTPHFIFRWDERVNLNFLYPAFSLACEMKIFRTYFPTSQMCREV